MITTEEFIDWLEFKKHKKHIYKSEAFIGGFNAELDYIKTLANKLGYTQSLRLKIRKELNTLRGKCGAWMTHKKAGEEEAILCCLSFIHSNRPDENEMYYTKIKAYPFSWNDNLSEEAIEDFESSRKNMSYCSCQSIGMALAKLELLEKLVKEGKVELDLDLDL